MNSKNYLNLLQNHIDISKVPFSDRGSRILIFRDAEQPCLNIKLAERLIHLDPDPEAYLRRPPFVQKLFLIDANAHEVDFSSFSMPHLLSLRSMLGSFEIAFQDLHTVAIGIPSATVCGLRFQVFPQFWQTSINGGKFCPVCNLNYNTNGKIIRNQITPLNGGYQVELIVESNTDTTITLNISSADCNTLPVQPFSVIRSNSENRWKQWFDQVPEVHPKYAYSYAFAWWVMANNLVSAHGNITYEAMIPSNLGYVGLWLWDNAMHTLAFRHNDPELARNQIRVMLDHQLPNGMLPDVVFDEGIVTTLDHPITGEVTKPPILAWAVLKIHEIEPDLNFLTEVYDPLVRLNEWWFTFNDDDMDGILQYNHPYSSGLDDSPLWDQGMPVESPDINTYLYIHMSSLAVIADQLNKKTDAQMWRRRAADLLSKVIEHFWDAETGLFWAQKDHQPINVITPINLYPLWTGQLPKNIQDRLLEHLRDPRLFWSTLMLPTVARCDQNYDPKTMWRGPVWANINYFFIEALNKIGEAELSSTLRGKTLDMIMAQKGMYEYYDANTGMPPEKALSCFGWTSAVFIDLALQASRENTIE